MPFQLRDSLVSHHLQRLARRALADRDGGPQERGRERYRRAGLSAIAGIGGRVFTMALSLVTVPLTLNYLGPERYGMWLTISSMIALLSFTDLGLGNGLLNAVTRTMARGELAEARRQTSSALAMLAAVAIVIAGLFALCYPSIPWAKILAVSSPQAVSEAGPAVAVWMALFLAGLPLSVAVQVRLGRQEGYLVHLTAAAGSLGAVVGLLVVIVSHQGVPFLVAAMGGPPLISATVNAVLLFRRDAPELRPVFGLAQRRTAVRLLRAGFLFFVLQIAMAVAFTSDTLVVAQIIGAKAVAEYAVASKLFLLPTAVVAIALSPLWPAYGEAIARGDIPWTRSTLARSIKAGLFISIPVAAVLVAFGQLIIRLWVGTSVTPPFLLLLGLGIWVVLSTIGNAIAMLLNGAHEIRLQAAAAVVMAVVNLALSIWLTSRIGVAGVMWGTVIAYSLFVLLPMALYVPGVIRRIDRADVEHNADSFRIVES